MEVRFEFKAAAKQGSNQAEIVLINIFFRPKSITFAAPNAHVVKLVDTSDLGSDAVRCGGSSPSMRTCLELDFLKGKLKNVVPERLLKFD